jgi:hypothetical protein
VPSSSVTIVPALSFLVSSKKSRLARGEQYEPGSTMVVPAPEPDIALFRKHSGASPVVEHQDVIFACWGAGGASKTNRRATAICSSRHASERRFEALYTSVSWTPVPRASRFAAGGSFQRM